MSFGYQVLGFGSFTSRETWITIEANAWLGDTGTATLGSGTAIMNTGDKNIRTALLVGDSVDFDFEVQFGDSGSASESQPLQVGIADNGTRTGAGTPTTSDTILSALASGDPDQGGPGWKVGNGVTDSSDQYAGTDHNPGTDWGGNKGGSVSNSNWMSQKIIGFSRRGSQIYGLIDQVKDYTYGDSNSTTSNAVKFWLGCGGSGAWPVGATNIRYRIAGSLYDMS
jgi:hypothetical protein